MSQKQGRNDVKESIVLLCRLFKYSGICENLLPDHIRQAKFDKSDVVSVLLHLLHALMYSNRHDQKVTKSNFKEVFTVLDKCRYPRVTYLLDEGGNWTSSREILLAVAWYMNCDRTIEKIKDNALKPADILGTMLSKTMKDKMPPTATDSTHCANALSMGERSNRVTWSVAQINYLVMQINSLCVAIAKKRSQMTMNAKTEIRDNPLLLFLLRHEALCKEYEKQLERKILLLQAYVRWREVDNIFWLWMDSVLTIAKQQAKPSLCSVDTQSAFKSGSSEFVSVLQQNLVHLQQEFHHRKKQHEKNKTERMDLMAAIQPEQKVEIERELSLVKNRLKDENAKPVLIHDPGDDNDSRLHHGSTLQKTIPVTFEYERLKELNCGLEKEIDELRLVANETLTKLSQRFSDVVLIAPTVPKVKRHK